MIYSESDFIGAYPSPAMDSRNRLFNRFRDSEIRELTNGEPVTLRLGYHPSQQKHACDLRARFIVSLCEYAEKPLTKDDVVIVIGGAFNWLGEALEDYVPGLESWCVDPSPFVHANKDKSPDQYLRDRIKSGGHEGKPIGDYFFDLFSDPNPWSRSSERILHHVDAFPANKKPTVMIAEDCWQAMRDPHKLPYREVADRNGIDILVYIEGEWH